MSYKFLYTFVQIINRPDEWKKWKTIDQEECFSNHLSAYSRLVRRQTIANSAGDQRQQERNSKDLFPGKPVTLDDRIERVKIAIPGIQRYYWEQDTLALAFLKIGEDDLSISFAREAIFKPISLQ